MSNDALQLLNFALAVINFAVASVLVIRGLSISREIGAASVTVAAQSAYEDLVDSRARVVSEADAQRYYDRFWAAQAVQYEQWRRRLLPDLLYWDWMVRRREQFDENHTLGGVAFRDAWQARFEKRYRHTRFGAFMSRLFAETRRAPPLHTRRVMRRERPLFEF